MKLKIKILQHVLTDHCNLRCENCFSLSPLIKKHYSNLESFKRDIDKLKDFVEVDRFEFVGGEPLLHKQIDQFIKVVKESGICNKICIFTNAKYLPKMSDYFYNNVSDLWISAYPNTRINYKNIKQFLDDKKSYCSFDYNIDIKKEFYVSHKETRELDPIITDTIYKDCKIAHVWKCALIKDGYYYKCNIPYFKNKKDGFDNKLDGIDIHNQSFPRNLYEYLANKSPLESCNYCYGTSGEVVEHKQIKFVKKNV